MSAKHFEAFLVSKLREWLGSRIETGARYQFKSPDPENTKGLVEELIQSRDGTLTIDNQELSYHTIGSNRLLVTGHLEQHDITHGCYTENYISRLRDAVAAQEAPFNECALLIIHNSLLDTLINSALDLAQGTAVWSPRVIKEHLESLISVDLVNQVASRCLLEHQVRMITDDGSSMFGFRHLHDSMIDGDLRFDELGLFNDPFVVYNTNEKQVERRLEANRQLHSEIEFAIEHYPNELEERLTKFGSKFIQKHFGENTKEPWAKLDYGTFKEEEDKQKQLSLEFQGLESSNCKIHQRNKKETAAGFRDKHLLIVVPEDQTGFELCIKFIGQKLDKKELRIQPNLSSEQVDIAHRPRGNKTTYIVSGQCQIQPFFFTLRLNRDAAKEKYSFHCMVIREGAFNLAPFINQFLVNRSKQALILQAEQQVIEINPERDNILTLEDSGQTIAIVQFGKLDFQQLYEESDEVFFTLVNGQSELSVLVEGEASKESLYLPVMMDPGRFSMLFANDDYNGIYRRTKETVVLDNQESEPLFLRKQMLRVESAFVDEGIAQWNQSSGKGLPAKLLEIADAQLYKSYAAFLEYFR